MTELFLLLYGVLFVLISVWNAYAVGYNTTVLKRAEGTLFRILLFLQYLGLPVAFGGATYGTAIILGLLLLKLGYISTETLMLLWSYNFLVFGGIITVFGISIMIESWIVFYLTRSVWDLLISLWNTFASIYNVIVYYTNVSEVLSFIRSSEDRDSAIKVIILLIVAALIGIILTYYGYRLGKEKAEEII